MKHRLVLLSSLLLLLINCRFFDDPVSEAEDEILVIVSLDADAVENTSCRLTVSAGDMTTIGPEESSDCSNIVMEVPAGKSRGFFWERVAGSDVVIDTGTMVVDVGPDMDTVFVALEAAIPPPRITTQPVDQSVAEGEAVTFSVAAEGEELSYQWQRGTTDIAGAASPQRKYGPSGSPLPPTTSLRQSSRFSAGIRTRCLSKARRPTRIPARSPWTTSTGILRRRS
ncbi:MAG: hypothetical protein JW913_06510 [Chitinispirillaceae bacterium]|nr:hypothetical protein [Chitinispirillaceae bacterium]